MWDGLGLETPTELVDLEATEFYIFHVLHRAAIYSAN